MEVPLFLEIPNLSYSTVYDKPMIASVPQNELNPFSRFDTIPASDGQTDKAGP